MALIKCKECGHEVSDSCQSCPNCGADIQQQIYDSLSDKEKKAFDAEQTNELKGRYWFSFLGLLFLDIVIISTMITLEEFPFFYWILLIGLLAGTIKAGIGLYRLYFEQ